MRLKNAISKRTLVVLLTLLAIIFGYTIYKLNFLPRKKDHLTRLKFESLEGIADNILAKFNDDCRIFSLQNPGKANNNNLSYSVSLDSTGYTVDSLRKMVADLIPVIPSAKEFTDFLLFIEDSILVYQSFKNKIAVRSDRDSTHFWLETSLEGYKSGNLSQITVSQVEYLSFSTRFRLEPDYKAPSIILVGLLDVDSFNRSVKRVDTWTLIKLTLALLVILMSMPWIKLISMNEVERLYRSNIVTLGIALLFGASMVSIILMASYSYLKLEHITDNRLKILTDSIELNFVDEVEAKVKILKELQDDSALESVILRADSNSENLSARNKSIVKSNRDYLPLPTQYNSLLWLDSTGDVRVRVSSRKSIDSIKETINLKERQYFSKVISNDLWTFNNAYHVPFSLESIRSWSDGSLEAGIAIRDDESTVVIGNKSVRLPAIALSCQLQSVINPIVEPGFEFAIVDQSGLVWFHSDAPRSLRENFIRGTENSAPILTGLSGRRAFHMTGYYMGTYYRMYMAPIDGIPLYVVSFYKLSFIERYVGEMVMIVFLMLLLLVGIIVAHLCMLYFVVRRPTKLKKKKFLLSFLTPQYIDDDSTFENALVIFILLLVEVLFGIFVYYSDDRYGHSLAPIFVIFVSKLIVFCYLFVQLNPHDSHKKSRRNFVVVTGLYVSCLNIFYVYFIGMTMEILLYQLFVCGILTIFVFDSKSKSRFIEGIRQKSLVWTNIPISTRSTLYLLLVVLVVFSPILFSYKYANNFESLQSLKFTQFEVAKSLGRQNLGASNYGSQYLFRVDTFNNSLGSFELLDVFRFGSVPDNIQKVRNWHLSWMTFTDRLNVQVNSLIDDGSTDGAWQWYSDAVNLYLGLDSTNVVSSWSDPGEHDARRQYIPWFLFIAVLVLVLLYLLISFSIRRFFASPFASYKDQVDFDGGLLKTLSDNKRIFVIDMPDSKLRKLLDETGSKAIKYGTKILKIDLREVLENSQSLESKRLEGVKIFFVDHFDCAYNNHEVWDRKFEILTKIDRDDDRKIVILSKIHPLLNIEFYQTMIDKSRDQQWNGDFRSEYQEYRHAKNKWKQFFARFVKVYGRIPNDSLGKKKIERYASDNSFALYEVMNSELRFGRYLSDLRPFVKKFCKNRENLTDEDIILEIQSLAEAHYYAIWATLSKREKFIVYDLAIDGFVNCKDAETVRVLLQKGIMRFEKNLLLMNKSFNNFVLTVVDQEMDKAMRKEMLQKGTWSNLQVVLILILIAISAFVFLEQKQVLSDFQATLTALVAAGGVIIRFSGLWGAVNASKS